MLPSLRKFSANEGFVNRGRIYYVRDDFERAIADLIKPINIKPDYDKGYFNLGLAYETKGQKDEAIANFRKALEFTTDMQVRQAAEVKLKALGAR
jgi:tetratricopeptide (TPR) repeat protein